MPTQKKRDAVAELIEPMRQCTIAIATDFRGLSAKEMIALRRSLRERSIGYRIVKNRLAILAARQAGKEEFIQLMQGSTGLAFGYGDPVEAAKALSEYVRSARSRLVTRAAVLDGQLLTAAQVTALAALPPKAELLARLVGQIQSPIARLVTVLNGPIQGLAIVLQRRMEQRGASG